MIVKIVKEATECKYCGSKRLRKAGTQKGKLRYLCNDCKVKFTNNGAFKNTRFVYSAELMISVFDLEEEGFSISKVIGMIEDMYGEVIGRRSVITWNKWRKSKEGTKIIKEYNENK
jgi:DNA-directed RNA polymerase subunit RPC12/RpoP